jgi:hypothetical protein
VIAAKATCPSPNAAQKKSQRDTMRKPRAEQSAALGWRPKNAPALKGRNNLPPQSQRERASDEIFGNGRVFEREMTACGFALSGRIRLMGEPRAALLRRLALGFLIASRWDFTKLSSATPFINCYKWNDWSARSHERGYLAARASANGVPISREANQVSRLYISRAHSGRWRR